MSTRFDLVFPPQDPCPTCGSDQTAPPIKIGHSAAGWRFRWTGHRVDSSAVDLTTVDEWMTYLAAQCAPRGNAEIRDEYGKLWPLGEFLVFVLNKRLPGSHGQPPARSTDDQGGGPDDLAHEGSRNGW